MAGEDRAHLEHLQTLECCAPTCSNLASQPHHILGSKSMSQRSHDHKAIPLCGDCHTDIHKLQGHFARWTGARRARFEASMVKRYRPRSGGESHVVRDEYTQG